VFTDANSVWKVNVPRLVQSWNRFILQQIYTQSATFDKNGLDENGGPSKDDFLKSTFLLRTSSVNFFSSK
jgi:hypothetical protein